MKSYSDLEHVWVAEGLTVSQLPLSFETMHLSEELSFKQILNRNQ